MQVPLRIRTPLCHNFCSLDREAKIKSFDRDLTYGPDDAKKIIANKRS